MDGELAIAQALRYAEELRDLHGAEQIQRRTAEDALARLEDSYRTTVRALAAALEPCRARARSGLRRPQCT